MTEQLWRERKPDDHWGEPGRWAWLSVYHDEYGNGVLDVELPMVPVAAGALLIEDGFDKAVERMVDDEWEAVREDVLDGYDTAEDRASIEADWREVQQEAMVLRLRAAVGEPEGPR